MSTSPKQNGLFEPGHRIDSEFQPDSTIVLAHADSLETLREFPDRAIKLVISSPPYSIGKEYEVQQKLEHYRPHKISAKINLSRLDYNPITYSL